MFMFPFEAPYSIQAYGFSHLCWCLSLCPYSQAGPPSLIITSPSLCLSSLTDCLLHEALCDSLAGINLSFLWTISLPTLYHSHLCILWLNLSHWPSARNNKRWRHSPRLRNCHLPQAWHFPSLPLACSFTLFHISQTCFLPSLCTFAQESSAHWGLSWVLYWKLHRIPSLFILPESVVSAVLITICTQVFVTPPSRM